MSLASADPAVADPSVPKTLPTTRIIVKLASFNSSPLPFLPPLPWTAGARPLNTPYTRIRGQGRIESSNAVASF